MGESGGEKGDTAEVEAGGMGSEKKKRKKKTVLKCNFTPENSTPNS